MSHMNTNSAAIARSIIDEILDTAKAGTAGLTLEQIAQAIDREPDRIRTFVRLLAKHGCLEQKGERYFWKRDVEHIV